MLEGQLLIDFDAAYDVRPKLEQFASAAMPDDHRAVYSLLAREWGARFHQRDIARLLPRLGKTEYEPDDPSSDSTLRRVRQIVRDLRVIHHVSILSDTSGYWLPSSSAECSVFLERLERTSAAQARAWLETYDALAASTSVRSRIFDEGRAAIGRFAAAARDE